MVTVHGYASPAQAEFFESMDLLWMVVLNHPEQVRRFIHEAEDFVVFSPFCIKQIRTRDRCTNVGHNNALMEQSIRLNNQTTLQKTSNS
jgi:hypothetical protein